MKQRIKDLYVQYESVKNFYYFENLCKEINDAYDKHINKI